MVRSIFCILVVVLVAIKISWTSPLQSQRMGKLKPTRGNSQASSRTSRKCSNKKLMVCKGSLPQFKKNPSYKGSVWLLQSAQDGYFLQITRDGKVNGTSDFSSKYARFEVESLVPVDEKLHERSYRIFWNKATSRYLCMTGNTTGMLTSKVTKSRECIFESLKAPKQDPKQSTSSTPDDTVVYRNVHCMFIGLRRNGKAKKGKKVKPCNRNAHFYEIFLSHYSRNDRSLKRKSL